MTSIRPTQPGWYWCEIPGARPLQPAFVFTRDEAPTKLLYTFDVLRQGVTDALKMENCTPTALWSNKPIPRPGPALFEGPWIPHTSDLMPVKGEARVLVKTRGGRILGPCSAHTFYWYDTAEDDDIVAYQLAQDDHS